MELKGSKTEQNLLKAFAGESQARNRYTYFASQAKKEGYQNIAAIFQETANHEKEHAKRLFKFLQGGELEITAAFPAGVISNTLDNLLASAAGEHYENSEMYPEFEKTAREEGFTEIATVFKSIIEAEKYHEERFNALVELVKEGKLFKRSKVYFWKCTNCGYIHAGTEPPKVCPACGHPQGYFVREAKEW